MKFLAILLCVALVVRQGHGAGCTITNVPNGVSNVIFTFSPTPAQVLAAASLSTLQSPIAIINLLQESTDLATQVITYLTLPFLPPPPCRYYWITNQLFCDNINRAEIIPLCLLFSAITNVTNRVSFPLPANPLVPLTCENDTNSVPWGINKINAPAAWAQGFNGTGVVVANIDSGVRYTHVELVGNMRPTYNWYNPYNPTNTTPYDDSGHGTHTMGTMVGKTVGVAPGAQWIACKGCNGASASCNDEKLVQCAQFLACPDNKAQNCASRPDVINNSWGGIVGDTFYDSINAVWKALGIKTFFASGNGGPTCGSVNSPADGNHTQLGFLSVGSTACDDTISSFSSVGPSQRADYLLGLGVQIVGPGTNVRSSWSGNDTNYQVMSGTSMSSPHVAGAAAVLLSKNKSLTSTQVYAALTGNAYKNSNITSPNQYCGSSGNGVGGYPNNVFGYGRVELLGALGSF